MSLLWERPRAADFERLYRHFGSAEALPWYHPKPPALLERVLAHRGRPGTALDLGCGAGMCSIHLARAGYEVTSVDYAQGAIDLANTAARKANVEIETVRADVLSWSTSRRFDIVLDSSCLHVRAFSEEDRPIYKQQILRWLADDGDFVIVHFDRRHALDWRPIGPRRRTRGEILALFSPELAERATDFEDRTGLPMPIGPSVRERTYWFRRNR